MKTIALEQVDQRIADALKGQRREDPILLTQGSNAFALLLRLPEGTKDSDLGLAVWFDQPAGQVCIVIEAKRQPEETHPAAAQPVFGGCKGMLTILNEDDEHLQDFEEYMR
jgi:hypothetical protein